MTTSLAPKRLTKLIRYGGKLAVLGLDPSAPLGRWHVAKPGTWDPPRDNSGVGLTYATALCGKSIATNGYAADFCPPTGVLCPACQERL